MAMVHEVALTRRVYTHVAGDAEVKAKSSFDLMPARADTEEMPGSYARKSGTCAKARFVTAQLGPHGIPGERIRSAVFDPLSSIMSV